MIWAFATASTLTFIAAIVGLILDLKRVDSSTGRSQELRSNRIDLLWTRKKPDWLSIAQREFWFDIFFSVVLSLSDAQLVSCLAIFCTALVRMGSGRLSTYHFAIIQDLAWLASNSNMLSPQVIQSWIASKAKHSSEINSGFAFPVAKSYRILKITRFVLMSMTLGLLLVLTVFSGGRKMNRYWNSPASCTAFAWPGSQDPAGRAPGSWMIVTITLLVWAYLNSLAHLLSPICEVWSRTEHQIAMIVLPISRIPGSKAMLWIKDFVSSSVANFLVESVWYGLGLYWLFRDWDYGQELLTSPGSLDDYLRCERVPGGETVWGFGQIFPIFMLLLPLLTLLEVFEDRSVAVSQDRMRKLSSSSGSSTTTQLDDFELPISAPASSVASGGPSANMIRSLPLVMGSVCSLPIVSTGNGTPQVPLRRTGTV